MRINHTPYSPDLTTPDYFLFSKSKLQMKGHQQVSIDDIEAVVTSELSRVGVEAFQKAFIDLYSRSKRFMELGGDYVEA